jgi:hypothetical protein
MVRALHPMGQGQGQLTRSGQLDPPCLLKEHRLSAEQAARLEQTKNEKDRLALENARRNSSQKEKRPAAAAAVKHAEKDRKRVIERSREI